MLGSSAGLFYAIVGRYNDDIWLFFLRFDLIHEVKSSAIGQVQVKEVQLVVLAGDLLAGCFYPGHILGLHAALIKETGDHDAYVGFVIYDEGFHFG